MIFPDGVERWYLRGKEMTRDINVFFFRNKWPVQRGLDTPEKIALFQGEFLDLSARAAAGTYKPSPPQPFLAQTAFTPPSVCSLP